MANWVECCKEVKYQETRELILEFGNMATIDQEFLVEVRREGQLEWMEKRTGEEMKTTTCTFFKKFCLVGE